MKRVVALLIVVGLLAGLVWFNRSRHPAISESEVAAATPPKLLAKPVPPFAKPPPLLVNADWQKYRSARQTVLAANPDLQSQYKEILQELDAQQSKLDAAMDKADPKATPIIAKLEALRAHNGAPSGNLSSSSSPAPVMTADDWQEVRTARAAAVAANPNLMTVSKALADKMRKFEGSLDAAMVKAHPDVAPVISKFEGRSPVAAASSSSATH
jgi:hypothetical protein